MGGGFSVQTAHKEGNRYGAERQNAAVADMTSPGAPPLTGIETRAPRKFSARAGTSKVARSTPDGKSPAPPSAVPPPTANPRLSHLDAMAERRADAQTAPQESATPLDLASPPPAVNTTAIKKTSTKQEAEARETAKATASTARLLEFMGEKDSPHDAPHIPKDDSLAEVALPPHRRHGEEEGEGGKKSSSLPSSVSSSPSPVVPGTELLDSYRGEEEDVSATTPPSAVAPPCPLRPVAYRPVARSVSPGHALTNYETVPLSTITSEIRQKHSIYRICLTGGPCAGKSTMLAQIQAKIPQRTGFRVMCVPEAATLLVTGGMQWDGNIALLQQLSLLRTQLALEDEFYALALASGHPTVIISDRGTMDGRAFCSDEDFSEILRGVGSTMDVLRDRYDAVLHMVTSACGAEEFYNLDNPARYEDLDGARSSDLKLQQVYVGHPMFRLLDNSTTFEEKIERGLRIVSQVVSPELGVPHHTSHFLVRRCEVPPSVPVASYEVHTTILAGSQMGDLRLLVRRVMADGSHMYFFKHVHKAASAAGLSPSHHSSRGRDGASSGVPSGRSSQTTARPDRGGPMGASVGSLSYRNTSFATALMEQQVESVQRIGSREYASLLAHADSSRETVMAEAIQFFCEGANHELLTLLSPSWAAGRQTLTVESCGGVAAGGAAPPLSLPSFLEVDREVPLEHTTTAFLISSKETGPLYTSLAFAPVFSRRMVSAMGNHADATDFINSTHSTPRHPSVLRMEERSGLVDVAEPHPRKEDAEAIAAPAAEEAVTPLKKEKLVSSSGGLASRNVNTVDGVKQGGKKKVKAPAFVDAASGKGERIGAAHDPILPPIQ